MESDIDFESRFSRDLIVSGLIIPTNEIKAFLSQYKGLLLNIQKFNCIMPYTTTNQKVILLAPECIIPESLESYEKITQTISLSYKNFSYVEVLKELLPANVTIPTGFETIGHIAHFNLNPDQLPYKALIGKVLIDKVQNIKTVVTKLSKIDNVFRTFNMEVIAGKPSCYTEIKEGNCKFAFDFQEVYWNSKLSAERDRVLSLIKPTDIICDIFAGVGPFSIRAAKKGCTVIANDLNPSSYKYLIQNAIKNKVSAKLHGFNCDAREFLTDFLTNRNKPEFASMPLTFDHLYMNLPMDALEFLDVLKGKFDKNTWKQLPTVHVYGFAKQIDCEDILINRVKSVWGDFDSSIIKFTQVRDISPRKFMFCLEFTIPDTIAYIEYQADSPEEIKKRPKLNEDL